MTPCCCSLRFFILLLKGDFFPKSSALLSGTGSALGLLLSFSVGLLVSLLISPLSDLLVCCRIKTHLWPCYPDVCGELLRPNLLINCSESPRLAIISYLKITESERGNCFSNEPIAASLVNWVRSRNFKNSKIQVKSQWRNESQGNFHLPKHFTEVNSQMQWMNSEMIPAFLKQSNRLSRWKMCILKTSS